MVDQAGIYNGLNSEASQMLASFWPRVMNDIRTKPLQVQKAGSKKDEPIQELPLARIKKIMKQDGEVKMISAEAPILFSKAAEIFISELSLRAWIHTEDNKRRTLQRNDIALAITKYDQFDFLIDIVPRDDIKPSKREEAEPARQPANVMAPEQIQYYVQLARTAGTPAEQEPIQSTPLTLPPGSHIIQQPNGQMLVIQPQHLSALTAGTANAQPQQVIQVQQQQLQQHHEPASIPVETHLLQQQQLQQLQRQQRQQKANVKAEAQTQSTQLTIQQLATGGAIGEGGQQMQFIRIPQALLAQPQAHQLPTDTQQVQPKHNDTQLAGQVIQLQSFSQLSQLQHASMTAQPEEQRSQDNSETESAYSQIYQSIQGNIPPGAIYVMAEAPTSEDGS